MGRERYWRKMAGDADGDAIIPILCSVLFLDMFSVSFVIPLIPHIGVDLGLTAVQNGYLQASYQLVGNVMIGGLSDIIGRKQILLLSFVGSMLSYLLLGQATAVWMLFASRLLVGAVKQTTTICNSIIVDLPDTTRRNRAQRMGKLSTMMGLGFLVGPTIGGVLGWTYSYTVTTAIAAALFLLDIIIVMVFLPNQSAPAKPAPQPSGVLAWKEGVHGTDEIPLCLDSMSGRVQLIILTKKQAKAQVQLVISAFNDSNLRLVLILQSILHVISRLFRTSNNLSVMQRFGVDKKQSGYLLSYFGGVNLINNWFGVGFFSKFLNESQKANVGAILYFLGLLGNTLSPNLYVYLASIFIMVSGNVLLRNTLTSEYTRRLPKGGTGGGLGVNGSIGNVCGIVTPTVAGYLMDYYGNTMPLYVATAIMLVMVLSSPPLFRSIFANAEAEQSDTDKTE